MGCCSSSMKIKELSARPELEGSIYLAAGNGGSGKRLYSSRNSSGMGSSSCSSSTSTTTSVRSSNRSIWSRSRAICDDFSEQPQQQEIRELELERSCGYYTCSSSASTPTKQQQHQLMRTQDMGNSSTGSAESSDPNESTDSTESAPMVSNLEWEMYMMQQAQRIMPKTSSPISQRRGAAGGDSYNKWRNYLQGTPAHMLHNVTHIPEAIAGHFCPTTFPAFSDLEEMESAAKRFKVDVQMEEQMAIDPEEEPLYTTSQLLAGHTHTITTDL
ncbi:uncharacterized protein [Drosophila pseudoobscura]|uniref:Uncharacterized protein n=1 Tax=Drosophila pseudoobscura pseudoobscura TaxID=46245 RepID=A0A6I8W741_DROPS|nr:uncharacterized protein LOC4814573 [Drosophila pseudoobscura]